MAWNLKVEVSSNQGEEYVMGLSTIVSEVAGTGRRPNALDAVPMLVTNLRLTTSSTLSSSSCW